MKIKVEIMNANGLERTLELPAKYEICERCRGKGTHTNPSIDGNGITSSEWAEWDDDEREGYLTGRYDVRCEEGCDNGKAMVIDFEKLPKRLAERIYKKLDADAAYRAEIAHERRMGY